MDTAASTIANPADRAAVADDRIALWNPMAAALWSLALTPAFGAWLHARNWERLGNQEKASEAQAWCAAVCILIAINQLVATIAVAWGAEFTIPPTAGLVLFAVWYCLSAHAQVKYVVANHGPAYQRLGWLRPILGAVAAMVGFLLVGGILMGIAMQ